MSKVLSEYSLEELWQLFPVVLKPYNPEYPRWYEEERKLLMQELGPWIQEIHHIGSTAIPGIQSKAIVDILLIVKKDSCVSTLRQKLQEMTWLQMHKEDPLKDSYNKGYTEKGYAKKVYHLHVRFPGCMDEVLFRDYLRKHKETCFAYETLKEELALRYPNHRDQYTKEKTDFIMNVLKKAKSM